MARNDTAHLTHAEFGSPAAMAADCDQAKDRLDLPTTVPARGPLSAPSIRFEDQAQDLPKPEINVSVAAARLADAFYED